MNELLDIMDINRFNTTENILSYVTKATNKDITRLILGMRNAVNNQEHKLNDHSPFSFIASPEISGAGGCMERSCRLKRTETFTIYSALYADKVYINVNSINNPHFIEALTSGNKVLKYYFATDLLMLNQLRPLLEKDIVRIVKPEFQFCQDCVQKYLEPIGLNIDIDEIENYYIDSIEAYISYNHDYDVFNISFKNVGDFFEHGTMIHKLNEVDLQLRNKIKSSPSNIYCLTKEEIKNYGFFKRVLKQEINRLKMHALEARILNSKLLTSKNFDSFAFETAINNETKTNSFVGIMREIPIYSLPLIYGTGVDNILRIREEENDAFKKYRLALNKATKERLKSYSAKELNEIYEDIIYPSFTELDISLNKLRKSSLKKLLGEFIIVASVVSMGVSTGFVPSDPKSILTTLGGISALTKAGSSAFEWVRKKDEIKENDYYFLWKLKNEE